MKRQPAPSAKRRVSRDHRPSGPQGVALHRVDELAPIFKMLSNSNRLKIILFLATRERSVSDMEMALAIRQPTLSQQIGELRDASLIRGRRAGKSAIYGLTSDRGMRALQTIRALNGAITTFTPTSSERTSGSRGSQPAAMFAAVFARNGAELGLRKHHANLHQERELP